MKFSVSKEIIKIYRKHNKSENYSLDFLKNNSENLKFLLMVDCPISDINILSNINLNSLIELKIANAKINNINRLHILTIIL